MMEYPKITSQDILRLLGDEAKPVLQKVLQDLQPGIEAIEAMRDLGIVTGGQMNLAAEMARLPEPETEKRPPDWAYWRWDLWQRAQQDDPHNFANWPCVYHTMLIEHWADIVKKSEYPYVQKGLDPRYSQFDTPKQRNFIHQAYHILRWQEATGLNIADMQSIYEFGGGYGAMALVCNRLGFKGKYYIYDLPEFALLQQWYLEECGVDNVEWLDGLDTTSVDLLIACYSLSETDIGERDRFLRDIPANSYLFLYSNKFEQYDNIKYFQHYVQWDFKYTEWQHSHIEHLPPESWYTFGRRTIPVEAILLG